jgi:hypothetical protein
VKGAQVFVLKNAAFSPVFCRHIGCSLTVDKTALENKPMKANTSNILRHNFAIWVMGRRPGWFKPQRYMYRCLRCKWAFVINDERRGSIRVAADKAGELTREEELRRIAGFTDGPCPGYQSDAAAPEQSQAGNVIPLRRENRTAKSSRDARAV